MNDNMNENFIKMADELGFIPVSDALGRIDGLTEVMHMYACGLEDALDTITPKEVDVGIKEQVCIEYWIASSVSSTKDCENALNMAKSDDESIHDDMTKKWKEFALKDDDFRQSIETGIFVRCLRFKKIEAKILAMIDYYQDELKPKYST